MPSLNKSNASFYVVFSRLLLRVKSRSFQSAEIFILILVTKMYKFLKAFLDPQQSYLSLVFANISERHYKQWIIFLNKRVAGNKFHLTPLTFEVHSIGACNI